MNDTKLFFFVMHMLSFLSQVAIVSVFCLCAYFLDNGWILLALPFSIRSYRHDFGKYKETKS